MIKISIKRLAALCMALAAMAALCACSAQQAGIPLAAEADVYDMQRLYRNASLVVVAVCGRTHTAADGSACCDISIQSVVAGSLEGQRDIIHCPNGAMKTGESYLLYLTQGEDVYQSEDMDTFEIVGGKAFPIKNGVVSTGGSIISLATIQASISAESRVISAQSETFFYKNISALSLGSDYIFIGKVLAAPAVRPTAFRSNDNGAIIENELPAAILTVEAYGSIKGELKYGSQIEIVYCPAMADDMIDAATLKPAACAQDKLPTPQEGGIYIFFLAKGPDEKQNYYFGVNPLQFIAELDEADSIKAGSANRALNGYRSLDAVVRNIKKALNG